MDLAFLDKLLVKTLKSTFINCCRYFSKICQSSNKENKICQRQVTGLQKNWFFEKKTPENFGLIKEPNMGETLKKFEVRKTLKFIQNWVIQKLQLQREQFSL